MPNINVDGIEYNTEDLSKYGGDQIQKIQFVDRQLKQIDTQIKAHQSAQNFYIAYLKKAFDSG